MLIFGGDFSRMGRGIQSRYARCSTWWRPHLENTVSYINAHLPEASSVAVLGAGGLLDVDIGILLSRCNSVHLFDADPGAVSRWKTKCGKHYNRRVFGHVTDLTESMDVWARGLKAAVARGQLTDYLYSCEAPVPEWSCAPCDGFISLNILGQIPLYWRDRVTAAVREMSPDEWVALSHSMGRLQEAHMQGLVARSGVWSILVTDTEYYFYRGDESAWRVEPALFAKAREVYDATFSPKSGDSWLWHIAPQFIESDDEGEIHRVEARVRGAKE